MDTSLYNIINIKNYHHELDLNAFPYYFKDICTLMSEFLTYTLDNIVVQNNKYYLFILRRGLETIAHCYKFLLLYTRNYELALFHCKKAYIYYVEFIGQIGYNNNSFLQLNSKDAILFVYKKTIFDIDNGERKNHKLTKDEILIMEIINAVISLYIKITMILLEKETRLEGSMVTIIQFCTKNISRIIDCIYNRKETYKKNIKKINNVAYFIEEINKKKIENPLYLINIIITFIKKNRKLSIQNTHINSKLLSPEFNDYLDTNSHLKLINWVFMK